MTGLVSGLEMLSLQLTLNDGEIRSLDIQA
jgi:hypothetical protein